MEKNESKMRGAIKAIYNMPAFNWVLSPLKACYDFYRYRMISDRQFIRKRYKKILGRYPDLDNPQLFTEKLQWLKLNDRNPLMTICADKYRVREYIKEKIGEEYLIPLVFDTDNPDDIKAENLPDYPVIIKTNHGSGDVSVVLDKSATDFKAMRRKVRKNFKNNIFYLGREWEYKCIKPHIIVEKLLSDSSGNALLNDYKI